MKCRLSALFCLCKMYKQYWAVSLSFLKIFFNFNLATFEIFLRTNIYIYDKTKFNCYKFEMNSKTTP